LRAAAGFLLLIAVTLGRAQESGMTPIGKPIGVYSVQFSGNKSFGDDKLRPLLTTQEPGFLYTLLPPYRWFSNPPPLHPITISLDSIALWNYYRDNGFLLIRITPKIVIDTPAFRANITFAIAESTAFSVDTTILEHLGGLTPHENADVSAIVSQLHGKRYGKMELLDSLGAVLNYLRNNGYIFARIASNPLVSINDNLNALIIRDTLETGNKYYFANIDIVYDSTSGDFCFAENAVLKELEFNTGEVFSEAKRLKSEENLKRLGCFEIVRIELRTKNADSTHVAPVFVHLKLRHKYDFNPIFVADNNYSTLNVGASATITDHNLGCAGQELSLSSSFEVQQFILKDNRFNADLKFLQPHLQLGDILDYKNTSGQVSAGFTHSVFPLQQNIWNVAALLSIREAEFTYFIPKLAFIVAQTYGLSQAQIDSLLPTNPLILQKQPNLLLSFTLSRDNTNNLFDPSSGTSGVLSITTNLLSTPYFSKIEATQKWYLGDGNQSVFAFRVHGGVIARYGGNADSQDVLLEQKFFAGGAYSLRGWPLYALGIGIDSNSVFGRTGYAMFEANAEWRYRWFILPDTWINRVVFNRLSSDFFVDAGNVWSDRKKWAWVEQMPAQIAVDIGAGMRYDTPVGPLRLDFGYRFYDPYSETLLHIASFAPAWPFIRIVHPQIQIGIGNAF